MDPWVQKTMNAMQRQVEADLFALLSGPPTKQPKTFLRASPTWPGYVIEEEREPGSCTCPKSGILHLPGCWVWAT